MRSNWPSSKLKQNAISLLNSRRRIVRPTSTGTSSSSGFDLMPSTNGSLSLQGLPSLLGIREWLHQLGHSDTHLNGLSIIHVAGTKGKGSTCAFINSFLRVHGTRTGFPRRVGLYTSPHLICVRERVQINSRPISEADFTKYFFEVWDGLSSHREGVDVAIYETHSGGEFDSTNVFQKPVVTGITTVGMDHVEQLGPSIENIAWHKAGIFKFGSPAFSTVQEPVVAAVIQRRAAEKEVELKFIHVDPALPANAQALKPMVQRINCSLALALVGAFLKEKAPNEDGFLTSHDVVQGIEQFSWLGRFHQIYEGNHQWFLDGAHNELSVQVAARWFVETALETQCIPPLTRILIFSHLSKRDGAALLKCISKSLQEGGIQIQHVILSTYKEKREDTMRIEYQGFKNYEMLFSTSLQKQYIEAWKSMDLRADISIEPTIEGALDLARRIGDQVNGMQTLVTGSLHLVGSALSLLQSNTPYIPYTPRNIQ